ncbi:hypothetical protein, partial [Yersinia enterocolitica]|uniref:hypothetical protein n=1 Tax=Yersinia enterocolitica TaxID=630 RepID=UPI003D00E743
VISKLGDGGYLNYLSDGSFAEMAIELLSLREQLAELKEWATNRAITDDARENENYTTLKIDYRQRQLRELLKTAKPAED